MADLLEMFFDSTFRDEGGSVDWATSGQGNCYERWAPDLRGGRGITSCIGKTQGRGHWSGSLVAGKKFPLQNGKLDPHVVIMLDLAWIYIDDVQDVSIEIL